MRLPDLLFGDEIVVKHHFRMIVPIEFAAYDFAGFAVDGLAVNL